MAKKEKDAEKTTDIVGTFPRMTSQCTIKQCLLKKGGKDIRFDNFNLSSDQTTLLDSLIETGEEVRVTISAIQGRLC